jgi:hypothetical protein
MRQKNVLKWGCKDPWRAPDSTSAGGAGSEGRALTQLGHNIVHLLFSNNENNDHSLDCRGAGCQPLPVNPLGKGGVLCVPTPNGAMMTMAVQCQPS